MDAINATHYLHELVKTLSNDRNAGSYKDCFTVTAIAGGKKKIDRDQIDCQFVIQHNSVEINIFWEDCGYKNYKDMGLYGMTNSNFLKIKELSETSFQAIDKNGAYELTFEW